MADIDDGGPAFPTAKFRRDGQVTWQFEWCGGLSIRDYLAAQAMTAIIAKLPLKATGKNPLGLDKIDNETELRVSEMVAGGAYAYADAMLKERKRAP